MYAPLNSVGQLNLEDEFSAMKVDRLDTLNRSREYVQLKASRKGGPCGAHVVPAIKQDSIDQILTNLQVDIEAVPGAQKAPSQHAREEGARS
jgi:hypothetical protein